MKKLLFLLLAFISFAAMAQQTAFTTVRLSIDTTTTTTVTATNFGTIRYNWRKVDATKRWQFWNGTSYQSLGGSGGISGCPPEVTTYTADHTLALTDVCAGSMSGYVRMNSASALTITIPLNATVDFDDGAQLAIYVAGTGGVTIDASAVTANAPNGLVQSTQGNYIVLTYVGSDVWDVANSVPIDAEDVTFTPFSTIAATNVQDAIEEVFSEAAGGGGDVVGPASATDGVPVLFDGTTGKLIKNSTPTGTGNPVLATSPTLTTPALGTPSAVVLTNGTGLPISGITGLGTGVGTWLATPSSANLATAVTDETGTGAAVFQTGPNIRVDYNAQTTNYTFVAGDVGRTIEINASGVTTLTIPLDATVDFSTGDRIYISQLSAFTVTVQGATGAVNIRSSSGSLDHQGQNSISYLENRGTDDWYYRNGTSFPVGWDGTYTPTLTNTTNVAASTAQVATYHRVGNTVTVSGQLSIDPTSAALTTLGISLPIASGFTTAFQLGGSASATAVSDNSPGIFADATNDRATLQYVCTDVTNHVLTYIFSYQVL